MSIGRLCVVLFLCLAVASADAAYQPVSAQVRPNGEKQTSGFFSFFGLFKKSEPKAKKKTKSSYRKKKRTRNRKSRVKKATAAAALAVPQIEEKKKNEDAKVLLVVGDRLAEGGAEGLRAVYADTPSIRVKKLVYPNQGLVKTKYPDWPEDISSTLRKEDVRLVVVFIGAQDDKNYVLGGETLAYQSPEWAQEYRFRIASLVASVRNEQLPLIWVGLGPAEDYAKSVNLSYLNQMYKEQVEPAGGLWVDIWQAFLDEAGAYADRGPDISGVQKTLRTKDGLYFTFPGYRKIAYFVEREIARLFGSASAFVFEGVQDDPFFIVLTGRLSSPELKLISTDSEDAEDKKNSLVQQVLDEENLSRATDRVGSIWLEN
ncbi:DUF459 domain-containing protein [Polycladidibacter hongkongensis]|uniref:SGNH/GDSL hydrolase family protein n=1 Tax=Polycladidibacter hongkongensis TaxID=1647556 RepID=UPI0008379DCB|nr:DUF459 domain-containing protein [Pseudovibrio hongkongensis]